MKNSLVRRKLIARESDIPSHDFSQILIGSRGEVECEVPNESNLLKNGMVAIVPNTTDHCLLFKR